MVHESVLLNTPLLIKFCCVQCAPWSESKIMGNLTRKLNIVFENVLLSENISLFTNIPWPLKTSCWIWFIHEEYLDSCLSQNYSWLQPAKNNYIWFYPAKADVSKLATDFKVYHLLVGFLTHNSLHSEQNRIRLVNGIAWKSIGFSFK